LFRESSVIHYSRFKSQQLCWPRTSFSFSKESPEKHRQCFSLWYHSSRNDGGIYNSCGVRCNTESKTLYKHEKNPKSPSGLSDIFISPVFVCVLGSHRSLWYDPFF